MAKKLEIKQIIEGSYYANLAIVGKGNQGASESKDSLTLTNYLEGDAGSPSIDKSSANAKSGTYYFKGWSEDKIDFALNQTLVRADIPNGNYTLFAYYQGTGAGTVADDTALYAILTYKDGSTKTYRGAVEIHNVWKDFYQAKVTVPATVTANCKRVFANRHSFRCIRRIFHGWD